MSRPRLFGEDGETLWSYRVSNMADSDLEALNRKICKLNIRSLTIRTLNYMSVLGSLLNFGRKSVFL